jgi:hypothetical protein
MEEKSEVNSGEWVQIMDYGQKFVATTKRKSLSFCKAYSPV